MNPLLHKFDTPFETPPFEQIKNEHFLPAIEEAIKRGKEDVSRITSKEGDPDFGPLINWLRCVQSFCRFYPAVCFLQQTG